MATCPDPREHTPRLLHGRLGNSTHATLTPLSFSQIYNVLYTDLNVNICDSNGKNIIMPKVISLNYFHLLNVASTPITET